MKTLGCMFQANLTSLGWFLPITAAIVIGCNLFFLIGLYRSKKRK